MASFALIFDYQTPLTIPSLTFTDFVKSVATYKHLTRPKQIVSGNHCLATKLDAPATRHTGVVEDDVTGSWLIAIGTVIEPGENDPQGNLHNLLKSYLQRGEAIFSELDGHFGLVIYDGRVDALLVVSDPFGFISIFYGEANNRIFVSTSALAVARAVESKPNSFAARYFMVYGTLIGERTLWQDVQRLTAAQVLKITTAGVTQHTYWRFELDETIHKLPLQKSVDCVIDSLSQTMQRGLYREEGGWLSLTGGFDSRTTAAMMQHNQLPFKTYCHGPQDARDVHLAAYISQKMGWDYEYFPLPDDWGQERADWLWYTTNQIDALRDIFKQSRIIREQTIKANQFGVSYWGYGGELYRGYYWKQEFFNIGKSSLVNYDRFLDLRIMPLDYPILQGADHWKATLRDDLKTQFMAVGEQNPSWLNTIKLDLVSKYLEYGLSGTTMSGVLGLQRVIAPFNLKSGVETVMSVNPKWRTQDRLFRLMLERVNPALSAIETADGGPALPMRLTNAYKFVPYWLNITEKLLWRVGRKVFRKSLWRKRDHGPAGQSYPEAQWRRDTLNALADQGLLDPTKMRAIGLYDPKQLQQLLEQAQQDNFKNEALLGRILALEMALHTVGTGF